MEVLGVVPNVAELEILLGRPWSRSSDRSVEGNERKERDSAARARAFFGSRRELNCNEGMCNILHAITLNTDASCCKQISLLWPASCLKEGQSRPIISPNLDLPTVALRAVELARPLLPPLDIGFGGFHFMRVTFVFLVFVLALQATAQTTSTAVVFETQTAIARPSQPAFSFAPVKQARVRIFDRKFLLLAGVATAATMLDVATTSHCMSSYSECQEGNPLLGSHPSTAKLYGVSFSMLGGQLLASAWMPRCTSQAAAATA